mgnify:CR=1 FL=1
MAFCSKVLFHPINYGRVLQTHRQILKHIRFIVLLSAGLGYLIDIAFNNGVPWFVFRTLIVGMTTLVAFETVARWPVKIRYGARWVYQVLAVACMVPLTTLILWGVTTPAADWPYFWRDGDRLMEFGFVTFIGLLVAPWVALGALVRQKDGLAREQKIYFELNQSKSQSLIETLRQKLQQPQKTGYRTSIRIRVGAKLHVIDVEDIAYFQSDGKYTRVLWRNQTGAHSEGLIRSPLKALLKQLDPKAFAQTHRSTIVNLAFLSHIDRGRNNTGQLHLKDIKDILPISRAYLKAFRQIG